MAVTLGGPRRLPGCWRCHLLKGKAAVNIAIQKVGENAPNFSNLSKLLTMALSIQLSGFVCFGCACLILLTKTSTWGVFTIVSWHVAECKTNRKRKQVILWVALPIHLCLSKGVSTGFSVGGGGVAFFVLLCFLARLSFYYYYLFADVFPNSYYLISFCYTFGALSCKLFPLTNDVSNFLASYQWQKYAESSMYKANKYLLHSVIPFPSRSAVFVHCHLVWTGYQLGAKNTDTLGGY